MAAVKRARKKKAAARKAAKAKTAKPKAKKVVKKPAAKRVMKKPAAKTPITKSNMTQKMKCSACNAVWLVGKVNVKAKGKHACIKCGKKTAKCC